MTTYLARATDNPTMPASMHHSHHAHQHTYDQYHTRPGVIPAKVVVHWLCFYVVLS
jgi:hypothetical protein